MSNHNYSQYSERKKTEPETPIVEPEVKLDVVEETVETVTLPETVTGTVANCSKLNVRAKADATADVVCVIDVGSEVEINVAKSNADWLSVCTVTGIEGYCMRKFVDARL